MEVYKDKSAQEEACAEAYTKCVADAGSDQIAASNCLRDFDICKNNASDSFVPTADFGEATALVFNRTDASSLGVTHSFDEVRVGDSINVTDSKTGHFILAEIEGMKQQGDHIRFMVDTLSSSGGIIENNKCDVEFFNFSFAPEGPNLDNYVQKVGDTMNGELIIDRETDYGSALRILGDNPYEEPNLVLWNSGGISTAYENFKDNELVTKKFVEDKINEAALVAAAPARMGWKYTTDGTPEPTEVFYKPTALKISFIPLIGDKLYYHDEGQASWDLTPNTYFSMWEYDKGGEGWIIRRTGHVTRIAFHGSGIWMDHDEMGSWGDLKKGQLYYITVGGFIS